MANALEGRAYRPIDADSGGGPAAAIRVALHLSVVATLVLFIWPAGLRYVAPLAPLADGAHAGLVRMAAFAAFVALMIVLSVWQQSASGSRRREIWAAFASEVGGSLNQSPYRAAAGGMEGGLEMTFSVGAFPAVLSRGTTSRSSRSSSSQHTRLTATAGLVRDFQFQLLPNTAVNRVLMSPNVWKPILTAAQRQAEKRGSGGEQSKAVDRIRFLADAAITTGDPELDRSCFIKATDEALVRDLLGDPGVRSALAALQAADRGWRITLLSAAATSPAQLEVEVAGWDADLTRLKAMHALLKAILERLEAQHVLGRAAAA
jgi:hypothetical protein